MYLKGLDPRTWDLNRLLGAFEASLRQNAKDDAEWRRMDAQLRAEPKHVRDERRRAAGSGSQGRSGLALAAGEAEAMVARMMAADARFGGQ